MKKKIVLGIVSCLSLSLIVMSLIFFETNHEDVMVQSNNTNIPVVDYNNTRYISNSSSRVKIYDDVNELATVAPYIVTGECISTSSIFQNETLYTLSQFKIEDVFKGNLQPDSMIYIIEIGGRTTFSELEKGCNLNVKSFEKNAERLAGNYNVVIGTDGYFPLQKDEEVLLFLGDTSGFLEGFTEPLFDIFGTYDGKFYKQNNMTYVKSDASPTDNYIFSSDSPTIELTDLPSIIN